MIRKYFGTDGIRGRVNAENMTAEMALRLGLAAGVISAAASIAIVL